MSAIDLANHGAVQAHEVHVEADLHFNVSSNNGRVTLQSGYDGADDITVTMPTATGTLLTDASDIDSSQISYSEDIEMEDGVKLAFHNNDDTKRVRFAFDDANEKLVIEYSSDSGSSYQKKAEFALGTL